MVDNWIWALGAVVAGVVLGAVLGLVARRWLSSEARRPALRAIASPASAFLFWGLVAAGVIFAIGSTTPDSLRPIPNDIIGWMPDALIAGLLILGGYAAGLTLGSTVGAALAHATGEENRAAERAIRWAITGGAAVLALGQLGVETTIIAIVIAGLVFGIALTFALLAGLGGRKVADQIAVSRTLRNELHVGDHLEAAGTQGIIVQLNATTVVVEGEGLRRTLIPYSVLLDAPFTIESGVR
ncbi:MAG: hypothetical protein ACR2P0_02595 [Acidimicrobiales bacterium]